MVLIENDIFTQLRNKPLVPGTVLFDVKTFPLGKTNVIKIALVVTRRDDHWTPAVYCPILGQLVDKTLRWDLCPWISDQILNELSLLAPPSLLFSRVTPEDDAVLVRKQSIFGRNRFRR